MTRWKQRPEGSNWGDFGPDDQYGTMNLITPARRLAAMKEVREGHVFPLSLPLDHPRGSVVSEVRHPPRLSKTLAYDTPYPAHGCQTFCDDKVEMCLQFSTQWDALAHVGALFDADGDGVNERVYYNGYLGGEHICADAGEGRPSAKALGIEKLAETCVQGRGVMADLHARHGYARKKIDLDELLDILAESGAAVEPGDILCLHTGLTGLILDRGDALTPEELHSSCTALDGSDDRLLDWIQSSGISAIIADNISVEYMSLRDTGDLWLPIHHKCLFKLGMPLGELWYLRDLANWLRANSRSNFLLTAPPLRLPGAVGSPVSGVATV